MRRSLRIRNQPIIEESSDEETAKTTHEKKTSKPSTKPKPKNATNTYVEDSSSASDIENYLQSADTIDLNSSFFDIEKRESSEQYFAKIEKNISTEIEKLSDSESDKEKPPKNETSPIGLTEASPTTSRLNFQQLYDYKKKIEDAKKYVEKYNARKKAEQEEMNVSNILAVGERKDESETFEDIDADLKSSDFESLESEEEGWEEVNSTGNVASNSSEIPVEGLQITVEMPDVIKKNRKGDLLSALKRQMNRTRKEHQVSVHKVHLLCWIAHGNYVSSKINSENVLASALSLLPSQQCYPPDRTDLKYLEQIVKWYGNTVVIRDKGVPEDQPLDLLLLKQMGEKEVYNKRMFTFIFVAILRALGIQCRIVFSFQVEPLRPPNSELCSLSKRDDKPAARNKKKAVGTIEKESIEEAGPSNVPTPVEVAKKRPNKKLVKSQDKELPLVALTKPIKAASCSAIQTNEDSQIENKDIAGKISPKPKLRLSTRSAPAKKKTTIEKEIAGEHSDDSRKRLNRISTRNKDKGKNKVSTKPVECSRQLKNKSIPQLDGCFDSDSDSENELNISQLDGSNDGDKKTKPNLKNLKRVEQNKCPVKNHPQRMKKTIKYRDEDSDDDFAVMTSPNSSFKSSSSRSSQDSKPSKNNIQNDVVRLIKKGIKDHQVAARARKRKNRRNIDENEDEDSDFVPEAPKRKHHDEGSCLPKLKVKQRLQRKVLSSDDEMGNKKNATDVWAEVFLENEGRWISADLIKKQVHCVSEIYGRATKPVSYVVAWNNDNSLKDVTRRYCQNFNTITRKLRVDIIWWEQTLKPYQRSKTAHDKEEDDELERAQLDKPLPKTISEYKDHPLYVLKRHLLKYQAIYPPDAPSLGFVRNEPIYSRECVYTLHSREIWLKEAKVVKRGEQPYKIVKARPKYDKLSNTVITDQLLEIFGPWQIEDYVPPTAENGVVPRNAFGNVELFKPCMLPKKTVHLRLPGLNKIAKRMEIDCASAIVGFDFHGGWSHPTFDGFVVCEEFEYVLLAAWELEQEEIEKKEQEKIEKRVYSNWKKLIKGLIIRERLKIKYDFGESSTIGSSSKINTKPPKLSSKKRRIESDSD